MANMKAFEFINEDGSDINKLDTPNIQNHKNVDNILDELKTSLIKNVDIIQNADSKDIYDLVGVLMMRVANKHHISGKELHDMWVDKYSLIPDDWIIKYNTK